MSFSELLGNVGLFGGAVMCALVALSVFSVGLIVEKHRRFRAAMRHSQAFKPGFGKFLHGGELQELIVGVRQHENSHVARVVSAGINEYDGVRRSGGDPVSSLELVTSALEDAKAETLIHMKRGLGFLATIGSTAPFIAEALVATALGIFVAIPAVVAFNHFTGKLENVQVEMNRASSQLVNCLFKVPEVKMRDVKMPVLNVREEAYASR